MAKTLWHWTFVSLLVLLPLLSTLTGIQALSSDEANPAPAPAAGYVRDPVAPQAVSVTAVAPGSAPNDLDAPIVITGTGFTDGVTVTLNTTELAAVGWASGAVLTATVPWGLEPGAYTLTVFERGGGSGSLPNAFTVTQGLGSWNATALYGGAVRGMALDPLAPATIYAAAQDVGLFRSGDGGTNWSYVFSGRAEHLAVDPLSPSRLYVGGAGVSRSDDEGATWTLLGVPDGTPYPHPTAPGTVFFASSDESHGGLWRSTDYGQTWLTITAGLTDTRVTALALDPTDPITMYVGTEGGNLFLSADGGDSWAFISRPVDVIQSLAVNPRGAHEMWVSNCCFCAPGQVLKSTNPGYTAWAPVAEPVGSAPLPTIVFPPLTWGGDVYSGTVFVSECFMRVHKTTDGGASWANLDPDAGGGDGHWGLALHPTDPNILHASSDWVGAYRSTDGGATWQIANQGLTAVVPKQLATIPGRPDVVYAVTERPEGIYEATGGGEDWEFLPVGADVQTLAVDAFTPTRLYAGGNAQPYAWGLRISEDGGQSWPTAVAVTATAPYSDYNAVGASLLRSDPAQPGTLLAGVNHIRFGMPPALAGTIYRSTDGGLTWDRTTMAGGPGVDGSNISDIAYDTLTPTIAYATTEAGSRGIFRSTDGGQSWQRVGAAVPALDDGYSIAVEPVSPYRVFIWTGPGAGIYVSADHGTTWSQAVAPLQGRNVEQLLFVAGDPPILYAATTSGLMRSGSGAHDWGVAVGVLGQVPVYSLAAVREGEREIVYVGTTGGTVEAGALSLTGDGSTLVNAGIYRQTTLRPEPEALPWEQSGANGLGSPNNYSISALDEWAGALYAGTWNDTGPAQLWRSADGYAWNQVNTSWAISNTDVADIAPWGAYLYVGTFNQSGGEVWRTDGATWEQVAAGGFGDVRNTGADALAVFSDALYVATSNISGTNQVWQSPTGELGSWTQSSAELGGPMEVYSGSLYASSQGNGRAELWRTVDGLAWTPAFTDGLGDPGNTHVVALAEFQGRLYVGLRNLTTGGQVWRSADGVHWEIVLQGGLGNPDNGRPYGLLVTGEHLYLVFSNLVTGAEVWRTSDGEAWLRANQSGWGDPLNGYADYFDKGAAVFRGDLYIGTIHDEGGEVWQLQLSRRIYLPVVMK